MVPSEEVQEVLADLKSMELVDNETLTVDIEMNRGKGRTLYWTGEKSYVFYNQKKTWYDAEMFCRSQKGHLASVASLDDKKKLDAKFSW